jgi:squalene synthase HpnC
MFADSRADPEGSSHKPPAPGHDLRAAYAECERMAREHYENFPVASLLLPRAMRPHVAAVYAFARVADDFADEGTRTDEERLQLLDAWADMLHRAVGNGGHGGHGDDHHGDTENTENALGKNLRLPRVSVLNTVPSLASVPATEIFLALHHTIREKRLPGSLFDDLLSAFRQDVTVHRYATWTDLLDYCRRSANPVGRLVLRIAGYDDPALDRASDALCMALQLANFWQDLERDWNKGRLYVPRADLEATGASESDLDARRITPAWRAALAAVAARTRALFEEGRAVADGVSGRLRWELRLTWLGGVRILDRLERTGFDVFRQRPSLGAADAPLILWRALAW